LFAFGNEVQDGLKIEEPRAFYLPWFADGYAAEVPLAGTFIKLRAAEAGIKFHPELGGAYPDGKPVGLILQ